MSVWMYGPSGESKIFDVEGDAPDGWADHPAKVWKDHPGYRGLIISDEPTAGHEQSRDEVVAALAALGITAKKNAPTKALAKQLAAAREATSSDADKVLIERADIVSALQEAGAEFDPAASTAALYTLMQSLLDDADAGK